MKLQLASDLHTEMHRDGGASVLARLFGSGADILVLAGDICQAKNKDDVRFVLETVSPHYKHVIYVPGNHEFYGTTPGIGWTHISEVADECGNVHALPNAVLELDGQRFVVGTGWFPRPNPVEETVRMYMNDFNLIKNFEPWVYDQHTAFESLLAVHLQPGDVVITHHLPSLKSTPERFKNDALNPFFVSRFDALIYKHEPKLWLHGHTHTRCDYVLDQTRVVSNPLGYPSELVSLAAFDDHLTIDL